ncbi:hypothetical protein BT63DRAFT_409182 [Microthyrium microscopicum]|uniref:Uncharacterized protein n=1 Tax=Microthyrium microscopicum TaxID=703497 RepID=A0A6A6URW7_9PEZI|nr:hypothetical protein BT63DRAFT_409182 [Microthyrium microscopicum]
MSLPTRETEQQPFLMYTDSPAIGELGPNHRYQKTQSKRRKILSHCLVFVATSVFWILAMTVISSNSTNGWHPLNTANSRHNVTSHARLITCGNTTAEATARGCKYDILLNNWIPAQCHDHEFLEEYREDESWGAFADKNLTQRLRTVDEMTDRDHYYTSVRDHVNHCAMMWKKQFFYLFEERPAFDTVIASPGHTDHCAQYLTDAPFSNLTESTMVEVGFAGCWVRDEKL